MTTDTSGKRVGFWLGLGITFMPYFFVWALLKPGYSRGVRIFGFGYLAVVLAIFVSSEVATNEANANAKMFCSRFAVGGSYEQAVAAAMSDTTARKHRSRDDNGEEVIYVYYDAPPFLFNRIACVIEGKVGRITNVDHLRSGVD